MSLAAGTRLGPYEIVAPLGAGGMGEVYRARDAKLQRDVAIKVLPESLARDPDALERFEREAHAVAALSHPNILAIHDFGVEDGVSFAVMELLEGETLRARLQSGAIPQRKAVDYAQQMAQGLAAAHDRGIVHRDLKPENLFVTKDGRLKILDFGLAKRAERGRTEEVTSAPTATRHTDPGTVMGTVGYMSPEQVKGLVVDHRSDLFSFGTILYEMLSGERAFKRETAPETLTAILREEPRELSASSRSVEPALAGLVRHCLEKSPEERFQSARDLAYALSTLPSSSGAVSGATGRLSAAPEARRFPLAALGAVAAGSLLIGALAAGVFLRPNVVEPPGFEVLTYSGRDSQPSVSPDGKTIAFVSARDGKNRIWLKQRAGGGEVALTEGPDTLPRFSPDGSSLLFIRGVADQSALYRVPLVGGDARRVVGPASVADWSPDGREIGFLRLELQGGKVAASVHRVAADGTNERRIARVEGYTLGYLRWSPDGSTLAALETQATGTVRPRIALFPLNGGEPRHIESPPTGLQLGLTWNGDGRLLVLLRSGNTFLGSRTTKVLLMDTRTGKSRALFSGIDLNGNVEVGGTGSLVLVTGGGRANLRETSLEHPGEPGRWLTRGNSVDRQPVYAPDGEWVAFCSNRSGSIDVWEVSTRTGAVRRLTEDPADDIDPAFTRDGKHLLFSSYRSGHFEIWMSERDGSGARQVSNDGGDAENPSATPDGQWIVYASGKLEKRGIWKVRADGSAATRLVEGAVALPEISPDGRFVSFIASAGGSFVGPAGGDRSIRVVRLEDGAPVPVDVIARGTVNNRGRHRWMPVGSALLFLTDDGKGDHGVAIQDVTPGKDTSASRRAAAGFLPDAWTESLGVSPDGTRLTVSELVNSTSLLLADGVEGVIGKPGGAK